MSEQQEYPTREQIAEVIHQRACGCREWFAGDPEDTTYDDQADAVLALLQSGADHG